MEGVRFDEAGYRFVASDHYSLVPGSETGTLLLNDSHQRYVAQFAYLGHRLKTVPFCAAVCRIDHGNNAAAHSPDTETDAECLLGRIRRTRLITPSLKREFMLGLSG